MLPLWRGIAEFLLTKDGTWRQQHDKRQGLPQTEASAKKRAQELIRRLEKDEALRQSD